MSPSPIVIAAAVETRLSPRNRERKRQIPEAGSGRANPLRAEIPAVRAIASCPIASLS